MEAPKPWAHMLWHSETSLRSAGGLAPPGLSNFSLPLWLEWLLLEFLSQTDRANKPQLAFGHDPDMITPTLSSLSTGPSLCLTYIYYRTLHPCLTPGPHHSKHNTLLEVPQAKSTYLYLPVFVSNSSFSAEEEGLVLCICRCSSIGIKARGFQARLQPPFRTAPHLPPAKIPSTKGSRA